MIINEKMYSLGAKSSIIREIFEYGKKRKAEIGEENVFDFSLGNPNVPAPAKVKEAVYDILENEDIVINGKINTINATLDDITDREIILLGDSYGYDRNGVTGWMNRLKTLLKLSNIAYPSVSGYIF